jgi:hypothetical protein
MLFRARFNLSDGLAAPCLSLRYSADDAALVFLNGALVANSTAPPFGCSTDGALCSVGQTCCWSSWRFLTLAAGLSVGENTLMLAITSASGGSGVFVVPEGPPEDIDRPARFQPPASTGADGSGAAVPAHFFVSSGNPDLRWRWYINGPTALPATL